MGHSRLGSFLATITEGGMYLFWQIVRSMVARKRLGTACKYYPVHSVNNYLEVIFSAQGGRREGIHIPRGLE